jgi:hypothetical protein
MVNKQGKPVKQRLPIPALENESLKSDNPNVPRGTKELGTTDINADSGSFGPKDE